MQFLKFTKILKKIWFSWKSLHFTPYHFQRKKNSTGTKIKIFTHSFDWLCFNWQFLSTGSRNTCRKRLHHANFPQTLLTFVFYSTIGKFGMILKTWIISLKREFALMIIKVFGEEPQLAEKNWRNWRDMLAKNIGQKLKTILA